MWRRKKDRERSRRKAGLVWDVGEGKTREGMTRRVEREHEKEGRRGSNMGKREGLEGSGEERDASNLPDVAFVSSLAYRSDRPLIPVY